MNKKILYLSLTVASLLLAEDVFTLGEISIVDKDNKTLDTTKISSAELINNPEKDVAKVLDTTAGITLERKGGRNESSIIMRGFDAKRIGVYMDGIPIFVPYDGNFDYSRVLSSNLSSIDIAKGFSSSLYGPNSMAGVVNFVSKKPTKEFEGSFSTQLNTDNDFDKAQTITSLDVGSKQEKFYVQFSGTLQDRSHYNVSEDFTPTGSQENGERNRSDSEAKSLNLKLGLTPDSRSEYVFGYNYLNSEKSQPTITDDTLGNEKYNTWPAWDMDTLFFMANKTFSGSALKFKIYRSGYENTLETYKDEDFTKLKDIENTDAYSIGTNIEYSNFSLVENHIFKIGFNYKKDHHEIDREDKTEYDDYKDEVYSIAFEDIYQATNKLQVITSISYDYTKPKYAITAGDELETKTNNALNPQIGFFYDTVENQTTRFTLSRKSHLPTMKERFSNKNKKATPNPNLDPEVASHIELGHEAKFSSNLLIDAAVFYTKVKDPINQVLFAAPADYQEQNTGSEKYKGFETTVKYVVSKFDTGFNYTYLDIEKEGELVVEGVPEHQTYLFANYSPIHQLRIGANLSYKKGLMAETATAGDYQKIDPIVVANFSTRYRYSKSIEFLVGIENLMDEDYAYDLGYPEAGREYYAKFTYNF